MPAPSRDVFLSEVSLALHRSIVSDDALGDVLRLIAEHFRCLSAALLYVDEGRPGATIETSHGVVDADARRRYRDDYAKGDPAPAAMARLAVGEVATTDRLFDIEDDAFKRFREEFYYPLGLRGAMGGPVVKAQGRFGVLAVQRGADRPPFNDDEMAEFGRLVPLVASSLALRRKFFDLEAGVDGLERALEEASVAIMIMSGGGRLRHANRLARQFLERQDGLSINRAGRLKLTNGAADKQLQSLFATKPIAGDLILRVPRAGHFAPYVLRAAPSDGDIIVKLCDPLEISAEAETILNLAFDMSKAGARLTAALLKGETLADYSVRSDLSPNTVKFHLKNAFAATETNRQSDLVRVASAVVAGLGV